MYDGCSNFGKCENHGCPEFGQKCTVDTEALYFVFKSVQSPNAQKEDDSFIFFPKCVFFSLRGEKDSQWILLTVVTNLMNGPSWSIYHPIWSKTSFVIPVSYYWEKRENLPLKKITSSQAR